MSDVDKECSVRLNLIVSDSLVLYYFGCQSSGNPQKFSTSLHDFSVICYSRTCMTIEKNRCKVLEAAHPPDLAWMSPVVSLHLESCKKKTFVG